MKDQAEFDIFLITLRAWVMEITGDGPNAKSTWFRRQIYEAFPGFVLWATKSGEYQFMEPQPKQRSTLTLLH